MKLAAVTRLLNRILAYGTSEGVTKAWDTRGRSNHPEYQHGVHIGIFNRPEHPNQFAHSTQRFFHNPPVSPADRERIMRAFKEASLIGKRNITLSEVVPMQKTVVQSRFDRYRQGMRTNPEELSKKLPAVFQYEGKSYVLDGHHRLADGIMRGKKTDEAIVYALGHTSGVQ